MNYIYSIQEIEKDNDSKPITENIENFNYLINDEYDIAANQLNYQINYNIKKLNFILNFYNLKKQKNKEEIINEIIKFESNIYNESKVLEFKILIEKFIDLKNNNFFSKFIISPF